MGWLELEEEWRKRKDGKLYYLISFLLLIVPNQTSIGETIVGKCRSLEIVFFLLLLIR